MTDDTSFHESEESIRARLGDEAYAVLRRGATEAPFSGAYVKDHAPGMYQCAVCGLELFSADAKFDSGTGWPSFTDPANTEHVVLKQDTTHGMERTEVTCKRCGSHLGHVFDDGPREKGGKRYCINSVCLVKQPGHE
jgi:peptide-methionine (R)-S-oxide reductase